MYKVVVSLNLKSMSGQYRVYIFVIYIHTISRKVTGILTMIGCLACCRKAKTMDMKLDKR